MANRFVFLQPCQNCSFDKNWISLEAVSQGDEIEPAFIGCQRCGVGAAPKTPTQFHPNANWLECLPLTGLAARIPAGTTPDGFIAGDGTGPYSFDEYVATFNVDPRKNWCFRHPDAKLGCAEVEKYIPMPDTQQPVQPADDLALKALKKLKEDRTISESVYGTKLVAITRLKKLKDKDLISKDDYAKDLTKILGNDPKVILGL